MNPWIVKNFIYFPIARIRGENTNKYLSIMPEMESLSLEEIETMQWTKLKNLLSYAYENIPFYKKRFIENKIHPLDIKTREDFSRIPLLTKDDVGHHLDDLINKGLRMSKRSTSGTTGSPLSFYKDRIATAYMDAAMYYVYSWHGVNIGDKQARFWGSAIKSTDRIIQEVKHFLLNRTQLSSFRMTEEECLKFYQKLVKFKPKFFYGYANAINQFATALQKNKVDATELGVLVIICTGEILFDYHRKLIQNVFGCKVVNEYGTTENGILAFECEYGNMHSLALTVYLEFENLQNRCLGIEEDDCGEIIITELHSRSVPFIRYQTGDKGRLLNIRCPCRRSIPVMEIHEGRIDDYIKCPDGTLVYDAILAYTLKDHVIQFKAFQERIDLLVINIIPKDNFNNYVQRKLYRELKKYLGSQMNIEFKKVGEITRESSGKLRYFVSKIIKESSFKMA